MTVGRTGTIFFHVALMEEKSSSAMSQKLLKKIDPAEFGRRVGSLMGGLFVFYLIVSGNFVGELFNCDLQKLLTQNYWVKHLLGIITLYFFVNMVAGDIPWNKLIIAGMTMAMYALFIVSNRTNPKFQLMTIVLLFVMYILQLVRNDYKAKKEAAENNEEKIDIEEQDFKFVQAQWSLAIVIVVLIVIGFMAYAGKKRLEFGKNFSYAALFKGTVCRNKDAREYGLMESIKAFFTSQKEDVVRDPYMELEDSVDEDSDFLDSEY
jgi:uncharacterized membrane protein